MAFEFSTDGFLPYDTFDYIYKERKLPEFGEVASPYDRILSSWKFFLAQGESQVPFGFEALSFDDSDWDIINVPSTWQTEGGDLCSKGKHAAAHTKVCGKTGRGRAASLCGLPDDRR